MGRRNVPIFRIEEGYTGHFSVGTSQHTERFLDSVGGTVVRSGLRRVSGCDDSLGVKGKICYPHCLRRSVRCDDRLNSLSLLILRIPSFFNYVSLFVKFTHRFSGLVSPQETSVFRQLSFSCRV